MLVVLCIKVVLLVARGSKIKNKIAKVTVHEKKPCFALTLNTSIGDSKCLGKKIPLITLIANAFVSWASFLNVLKGRSYFTSNLKEPTCSRPSV